MLVRVCLLILCFTCTDHAQESLRGNRDRRARPNLIAAIANGSRAGVTDATPSARSGAQREFRLLATNKTSTMQKEMNEAADAGFHFEGTMGGETSFGGSEVVVIMSRDPSAPEKRYEYKLLATSKTSTMQKELQQAGNAGFEFKGQSVYSSTFGGKEVVVILERDSEAKHAQWEYKLLATKKTSTMQKELNEAGAEGFVFVGVTVGDTAIGGKEVVSILRRPSLR
ncbi:MAG TPA: hypothetical protein VFF31_13225 [Blastocatellia bacterium]|nr:hypothetical protein [Blastocatellia bacterium]